MRTRFLLVTAALLASSVVGLAQTQPPATQAAPAPAGPTVFPGSIDFGFRGTDTDVDEARYERYRDLRSGVASKFLFEKETESYWVDARAFNVGYRDQSYALDYARSKVDFAFLFDSIPTNYSYIAVSPWSVGDNGVLTIDSALRQQVQNRTAVGVPCAPGAPPASCSTPTNAAAALVNRSIYNTNLQGFEIQSKRDITSFGLNYDATESVGVTFRFASTGKSGHQPWGASFAFNNANELPLPIDNRTNDVSAGIEWVNRKGMVRFAWDGSFFSNDIQTLVWDNPIRATDFNNGRLPPDGPYDPSAYTNGNGPAQGRMALWPGNSMNVFSGMGLYKMPRRTTINGTLQLTSQSQDEALIPWTINPVIANPTVYAAFPHLASLPRSTAEAEVRGVNALLNFNSRPIRNLGFTVRYRYNDRDNQTPPFDASEWVRFDAVPEEAEASLTEQFDVTRQTFDANASYSLTGWGSLRIGYGHDNWERHGRGFSDVGENIFRISFDTITSRYVTLRAGYELSSREGEGFIETGIDYEGPGGTQPSLRYYDEADRDRNRGSLTVTFTPMDLMDVSFTYAGGHDEYNSPEQEFGLLEAETQAFTVGLNVNPRPQVGFGAHYGYETFSSLQQSRNANPPPDPSWFDPTRNWTLDNDEKVNTFTLYVDLLKAFPRTDVRVSYDYMDSNNAFVHGGPRIQQLNTNTTVTGNPPCPSGVSDCFIPVPDVETSWNRFTADLRYYFTSQVGLGFTWWYEKLDVFDYATIDANGSVGFTPETGTVRVDYLGGLISGYGARPYTGNTAFVRVLYQF